MAFASPWLLMALGAIAIPVAVHLVAREPSGGAAFPSLMFLSRIAVRERRARTLRDRALLALRCIAIALLAVAFAGPHALEPDAAPAAASGAAVAIVLDRSASMGYSDRWDSALAAAGAAIERIPAGTEGALVPFDTGHEIVVGEAGALRAALDAVRPGDGATDLAGAVEAGARWLAGRDASRRELVLVSDLQRTGLAAERIIHVEPGVEIDIVEVPATARPNAALVHATARPAGAGPRMRIEATVRVDGRTGAGSAAAQVTLSLDGKDVERAALEPDASGLARVGYEIAAPVARASIARLALAPDALAADDVRHLVLAPVRPIRVLVLGAGPRPGPSATYLARALEVAEEPRVALRHQDAATLDSGALDDADVVVLDDVPLAGEWLAALEARVASGAGLLVFAGEGVRGAWPAGPDGLVPGAIGPAREPAAGPARLAIDAGVPDGLESSVVWRLRPLEETPGDRLLLALEDGSAVALERNVGAGRSVAIGITLEARWSNIAREPGFVALAHELVTRLAGRQRERAPRAYPVGASIDLAGHARAAAPAAMSRLESGAEAIVRTPAGREIRLTGGVPLTLREAGMHEVLVGPHTLHVAANVHGAESDLATVAPAGLLARIARTPPAPAPTQGADGAAAAEDVESWWWRILLVATILLLGEAWLANRISLRTRSAPGGQAGAPSPASRTEHDHRDDAPRPRRAVA